MVKLEDDYVSPEGLDERVKHVCAFFITLTQGGKYRVYTTAGREILPCASHDTLEEAKQRAAAHMMMVAGMVLDPKGTTAILLRSMAGGPPS